MKLLNINKYSGDNKHEKGTRNYIKKTAPFYMKTSGSMLLTLILITFSALILLTNYYFYCN